MTSQDKEYAMALISKILKAKGINKRYLGKLRRKMNDAYWKLQVIMNYVQKAFYLFIYN